MRHVGWLVLASTLLSPTAACAEDEPPALRIGGGIDLFDWATASTEIAGMRQQTDGYSIGLQTPTLGLDVGALVLPWLAVGLLGHVSYGSYGGGSASSSTSTFSYDVLAYVEGSFRVDLARPFTRLIGGVAGSEARSTVSAGILGAPTGLTLVEGVVGGALGTHLFATSDFSISPSVTLLYLSGGGNNGSTAVSAQSIELQVGVTFFGWID